MTEEQLKVALEANRLTAEALAVERDTHAIKLELKAVAREEDGRWWLDVFVQNNGRESVYLQHIRAVFDNGMHYGMGHLKDTAAVARAAHALPVKLDAGCEGVYTFNRLVVAGSAKYPPPDYTEPHWRGFSHIELRANNQIFRIEGDNSHWLLQFRYGFATALPPVFSVIEEAKPVTPQAGTAEVAPSP